MLDNLKRYNIVLASNSPRRRDLLAGLGIEFEVRVLPGIDESYPDNLPAHEIPLYIAAEKAEANRKVRPWASRQTQPRRAPCWNY